jgi:regulator of PEP synthase PpsR (kinase-PPPase family)
VRRRTVYFVSDQTGVTSETVGHSVLAQFAGLEVHEVTLPFISTVEKAHEAVRRINRTAEEEGARPIVFSTLVEDELRGIVMKCNALFLDCFAGLVVPLERSSNDGLRIERAARIRRGRRLHAAHGRDQLRADERRRRRRRLRRADIVLVGVSRSGKTPTCLYMALQYGVFTANYPLTDDDLEAGVWPRRLEPHRKSSTP